MTPSSELKDLEELTKNAKQVQDDTLEEILRINANTEYLMSFLNGSFDKELFKKHVPAVTYEDIKPYIDRVANIGEPSNVISGETITNFLVSSGTSGGKLKIYPTNKRFFENRIFIYALRSALISTYIDGVQDGKVMTFLNTKTYPKTPSGIPVAPTITTYLMSDCFKNRSTKCYTSPDEVLLCPDPKQSMYCHLLCGLIRREEVVSLDADFGSAIVQAITFLDNHWKELSTNIRSGHISEWITDSGCRDSVSTVLGGPNSKLADLIEQECSNKSWEGIITRLWPNAKVIQTIVTGQMSQYISLIEFYSNKLPIFSYMYAASETIFGINVDPLCQPEDVSYTFVPNMSYFEFLFVDDRNNDEIVELVNVKIGCFYEPLVTNYSGLYRYRMGEILQVTGFYNSTPQFRFVRRKNVVLSVDVETTTEEDLLKALSDARIVLESSGLMLMGFTSYADLSTVPGHYVLYWELKAKRLNGTVRHDENNNVIVECCCVMEKSFNIIYRKFRSKYDSIGALEIRVVKQGTFDCLMEYFISQGASATQYKSPICISAPKALSLLEDKVLARFFSDKSPPPL